MNNDSFLQKDADSTKKGHFTPKADSIPTDATSEDATSCNDIYTDEEEIDSGDEEDHWVPHDDDFEALVIQATENDYELAAQLIPQLHKIFHQDHSSIVGSWEVCHQKCVGESSGRSGGATGGSISNINGSEYNSWKKRKAGKFDDDADHDQQDDGTGNNDPDSYNAGNNATSKPLLACPLHKKHPDIFNSSYRLPNERKGKYKTCSSGFDSIARLL